MKTTNQNDSKRAMIGGAGGGGGDGKTRMALGIVDFLRKMGVPCALVDAETEEKGAGMLSTYHPEATRLNINTEAGLDEAGRAAMSDTRLCYVDLGAGSGPVALPWLKRIMPVLKELGVNVTLFACLTSNPATLIALIKWVNELDEIGDELDWVVNLNHVHGSDFSHFYSSGAGKSFIARHEPKIIQLEKMWTKLLNELERRKLSIGQATDLFKDRDPDGRLGPLLGDPFNMAHLQQYEKNFAAQLQSIHEVLLP